MAMAAKRKPIKAKRCLVPGCRNKATSKGNCPTCRKAFLVMIERGERIGGELVTEDWLVARGWMESPKRKGRPAKSAAAKAVEALKK
jgi:hypothetical protein